MTPPLQDTDRPVSNSPIKYPGKIGGKMGFLSRKNARFLSGGVALLALLVGGFAQPAAAQQGIPPTPLPQVIATQQAANNAAQQVNSLQAERSQMEARLAEINRNIEQQIVEAERAAADARNAAATQNAVEAGAAIGRLEGALAQLRASYAGKDAVINGLMGRIEDQTMQSAAQQRTIDKLTADLQQAQRDKKDVIAAYDALETQQKTDGTNAMVNNAVWLIVSLAFLLAAIMFGVFVVQRRRVVVVEPPPAVDIIDAETTSAEQP